MRFSKIAASALLAGLMLPALAQPDTSGVIDRLDRLERDLNSLQTQVYRNQAGKAPSSSSSGGQGQPISGGAYGMLDDRINKLEAEMQDLTGQIEKNQYTASQLTERVERMQSDLDFRLKQIEDKQSGNGGPAPAVAPANNDTGKPGAEGPTMGSPPGFLGKPATPATPPPSPGKTAAEQYDGAYSLLRDSDYDGATRSFQGFIAAHPQDPLAGSAAYWLGQIQFAQGHFDQAAITFLDAYQKYPKSAKAPDSLVGVGLSMGNLGKKKEACAALHRFQTEYPEASDPLKKKASAERTKLGC